MREEYKNVEATRMVKRLVLVVFGMFGFGFAMVPLYDAICDITGLNGKTAGKYESASAQVVNAERKVKIQFLTNNNAGMPWEFKSASPALEVHPGEMNEVVFYAKNPARNTMTAQAIPSVTPYYAAQYLHKTECFCFDQQQLASGESIDMPMRFIIDSQIPEDIKSLTLSYTIFDITEQLETAATR